MAENSGELPVYNPDKQLSEQVTLKNMVIHDDAMRLALTGNPKLPSEKPLSPNQILVLRHKGLKDIISSQQIIVMNITAKVEIDNEDQWTRKNKSDKDKIKNKFEDEYNDYHELECISKFLRLCEQKIIKAKKTKMPEDDFIIKRQNYNGEQVLELTENFFGMVEDLKESWKVIMQIMYIYKIISSGRTIDEELEDKQKEEEVMRRIVES